MMNEPELKAKETKMEKDLVTKIVLGLVLMWAFGFAWGILYGNWHAVSACAVIAP